MHEQKLKNLLAKLSAGALSVDDAFQELKNLPFEDLGFAKIDNHRQIRNGFPEVIYCGGKTTEHVVAIMKRLVEVSDNNVLATRAEKEVFDAVLKEIPDAEYHELARLIMVRRGAQKETGNILVVSAGTSDLPVAEEAVLTAELMGNHVERLYDTGVAGIHRLLGHKTVLDKAKVIIVVAGMEGALASVVGGLVDKPVIAVPTSIGYGASFNGLAALLSMLNSCASGVTVVNIDNGFGAGYAAALINRMGELNK